MDPYLAAVAGALATVTGLFYKFLLDRLKRAEDRQDVMIALFTRMADVIEEALGINVERK
jgi:hypothetical protein